MGRTGIRADAAQRQTPSLVPLLPGPSGGEGPGTSAFGPPLGYELQGTIQKGSSTSRLEKGPDVIPPAQGDVEWTLEGYLRRLNVDDLKRSIQAYQRAARRPQSRAQIRRAISNVLKAPGVASVVLPFRYSIVPKGADLYRARKISEPGQIKGQDDVRTAPSAYIGAGRLNDVGEPLLYTAVNGATALYEVRATPGDLVALTRFRVTKEFQTIWLAPDIKEPGLPLGSQTKLRFITQFVEGIFTQQIATDDSHRYIAPDLLAKEYFNLPTQMDAWTYRSVADPGNSPEAVNTCIRGEKAKELLRYVGTDILEIQSADMRSVQSRIGYLGPSTNTERLLTAICQGSLQKNSIPDRSAVEFAQQSGPGMSEVAVTLARRDQSQQAESRFQAVSAEAHAGALAELGARYQERGQLSEAEELFRMSANKGNPLGSTYLGVLLAERGDNYEAEKFLRSAAEHHFPFGLRCLGVFLARMGNVSAAEAAYREAVALGDIQSMSNLGASLYGRGYRSEAETMFRKALAKGSPHGKYGLARILRDRGQLEEAETLLKEAAAQGQMEAMAWLGLLLANRGETARAEKLLRKAAASGEPEAAVAYES